MGMPKLTLPFAGRTVLEHVVSTLHNGGAKHVVVVTAPHTRELHSLAEAAGAEVLALPDNTPDMRTTIEHGLRHLDQRRLPQPDDAFFLAPADHPAFSAEVVRRLRQAYRVSHARSMVIPVHAGHRGHPSLIAWRHFPKIQAMPSDCGINAYLRQNPDEILEVETDDIGVLLNLDHPNDYVVLQRHQRSRGAITHQNCR
jgi:molybdenum cofactor cytidylyltransferase